MKLIVKTEQNFNYLDQHKNAALTKQIKLWNQNAGNNMQESQGHYDSLLCVETTYVALVMHILSTMYPSYVAIVKELNMQHPAYCNHLKIK